jgi:mRNA-degrading endonuclease RelE of RelBE toxin-antitoxin system
MTLRVALHPREAASVMRDVPPKVRRRMKAALSKLAADPSGRSSKLDVMELKTDEPGPRVFRLRTGDWRLAYSVRGARLYVHRIFHRSEGYGWLERLGPGADDTG